MPVNANLWGKDSTTFGVNWLNEGFAATPIEPWCTVEAQADTDGDGYRDCKAFKKSAVIAGFAEMPNVQMWESRPDKKGNPYSYVSMTLGAVRTEEKPVVRVLCDESGSLEAT